MTNLEIKGAKVLILEDAIFVREMEKKFLRGLGFSTFVETNSEAEAVAQIRQNTFRLALIDLHIPEGSGESAIEKIREVDPDLRIIVITSFPDKLRKDPGHKKSYDDILPKPFTEQEFRNKVSAIFND
ncbi:MAG: response regulator [Turneriella sp.]